MLRLVAVGADVVRTSVGVACEAVAVAVGVAVSTSREKARLGAEDIIIKECKEKNVEF